jgi:hypothetical protein
VSKRFLKFSDGSAEIGWEFATPKDAEQYEKLEELFDAVTKAARAYLKYVRQRSAAPTGGTNEKL